MLVPSEARLTKASTDGSVPTRVATREGEFASETDPAVLRYILKVRDSMAPGYWWVECGACECAWQVPHYAAESVG